jgi:hypothetical protein
MADSRLQFRIGKYATGGSENSSAHSARSSSFVEEGAPWIGFIGSRYMTKPRRTGSVRPRTRRATAPRDSTNELSICCNVVMMQAGYVQQ